MPRKAWKRHEIQILIENYEYKTTDELMGLLPGRNRKSINRKIEKLRKEGKIGHRAKTTITRAYRQRKRNKKKSKVTLYLDDGYEPIEEE